MMKHLYKWDLIYYFNQLKWLLISSIFVTAVSYLFKEFGSDNIVFSFLYQTTFIISIVVVIVLLVYAYFSILQRYFKTMHKDEGYFTHTLPISKTKILVAKMLSGFSVFMLVVLIGLGLFMWLKVIDIDQLKMFYELDPTGFNMILLSFGSLILTGFVFILVFYAAMSFGFSFNKSEWLYVFIFFILYYVANQVLGVVNTGINYLFNPNIFSGEATDVLGSLIPILITQFVLLILEGVACFFIANHFITKKLNLKNG